MNWLNVSRRSEGPRKLIEEVHQSVVDHMMAGIEEVLGHHGDFYLRVSPGVIVGSEKLIKTFVHSLTVLIPYEITQTSMANEYFLNTQRVRIRENRLQIAGILSFT